MDIMGRIDWTLAIGEEEESASMTRAQDEALVAIGKLVCAWGLFEGALEERIAALRTAAGEVRAVGNRTRPGMSRRFAELRAVIAMRDRRNAEALNEIAIIEGEIQRVDTLRLMIVEGFHGRDGDALICRDGKNRPMTVGIAQIGREAEVLDRLREKIAVI